jgi:DNA/RNA endonuclease YhcR with UshA esterase domain
MRFWISALLAVSLSGLAGPASAHHSIQAQFDINKTFSVTGTVSRVEFINPHSYLTVNVKDADGKVTRWAFEMAAAAQLRRGGLSRADRGGLKPGDEVTVTALAARDGSNSGLLQELKMADGRQFKFTPDPNGN